MTWRMCVIEKRTDVLRTAAAPHVEAGSSAGWAKYRACVSHTIDDNGDHLAVSHPRTWVCTIV